jgi:RND family efflux transporter MFP subunit
MKKSIKFIIIIAAAAVMVAAVAKRRRGLKQTPAYGMRPLAVHTADVIQETLENSHSYLGTVKPLNTARISSRISARVVAVPHHEGDLVKQGELLLQLDDKDLQAQIKVIDSQIAAMQSTIKSLETNKKFWEDENRRDSKLAEDGVISTVAAATTHNRMSDAVSKYLSAKANLESLRSSRVNITVKQSYTRLTAPFDGQLTLRNVDPGDLAAPGQPLAVLEDRSSIKIEFAAPQADVEFLKIGMPVYAEVGGKTNSWKISRIYPALNQNRMITVEVETKADESLKSGAFISLKAVWLKHDNAVTVPNESIMQQDNGGYAVFEVKEDTLRLQPVKKIMSNTGRTEVEGLTPGSKVVTSTFLGWVNLSDGLKVEVVK